MAVTLKFKAMGSAPMLNKDSYKIKTSQRFENVVVFLRNQLGLGPEIGLYLYVNFAFMPALDENVGNLWAVSKKSVVGSSLDPETPSGLQLAERQERQLPYFRRLLIGLQSFKTGEELIINYSLQSAFG
jgi:hypothetical protein